MQLLNCTIAPRFTIVLIVIEMLATIQALWFEIFYVTPSAYNSICQAYHMTEPFLKIINKSILFLLK